MKHKPFYFALFIASGFTLNSATLHAGASDVPVAIVYQISGTASATARGVTKPIVLFSRLPAGAVIVTGTDSSVTLAFSSGNRCEVGPAARVSLTGKDCVGPARRLSPVPILPFVPRTVVEARQAKSFAAVRVRANEIRGLYPHDGATTLSGETVLRFSPQNGSEYEVRVMDQGGRTVFESTIRSGSASVPPGVLKPGTAYSWTVRSVVPTGAPASGRESFVTVPAEAARRRDVLKKSLLERGDPTDLVLLGGIDEGLGLLWEAREELGRALAKDPHDENLREAAVRIESAISIDKP